MDPIELVSEHVPAPFLTQAVETVKRAPAAAQNNDSKREWSIKTLQGALHVSENIARLLVELGVLYLRTRGAADGSQR